MSYAADIQQPAVRAQPSRWLRSSYTADVSVVIVNYNSREMLERTLATLYSSGQQCSIEVILVDNASGDGSVELVREKFSQVLVFERE